MTSIELLIHLGFISVAKDLNYELEIGDLQFRNLSELDRSSLFFKGKMKQGTITIPFSVRIEPYNNSQSKRSMQFHKSLYHTVKSELDARTSIFYFDGINIADNDLKYSSYSRKDLDILYKDGKIS